MVVDNTNPAREDRAELARLGHQHGATVVGYYFEPQMKQSLERNALRKGGARVPDVAIYATMKKLTSPSRDEGFDRLFYVRTMDGGFDVSDWQGSP